ncbi:MAG: hypothetical protein WBO70_05605 [Erysipelotrichaceae bacterium]
MNNIVYSHEHISIDLSYIKKDADSELNILTDALDEFKELKKLGVEYVVDCSNHGMGADWNINKIITKETGINIINSTGFYKSPFIPDYVKQSSVKQLSQLMIKDIEMGAKIIGEIGTSLNEMTKDEEKVFEAACLAANKTNTVIITHTTLGTYGLEQIDYFKKKNVNLKKVILSHVALANDFDYLVKLVESGANIAFDTIGKLKYLDDETRVLFIKKLIDLGYVDQILMSMDITRKSHLKKNGGPGYTYLIEIFVPLMIKNGINEVDIEKIMTKNFMNILEDK